MPKITRTIAIDPEILAAVEERAAVLRERPNAVIQRACLEYLERVGAWPPKEKSPQAEA